IAARAAGDRPRTSRLLELSDDRTGVDAHRPAHGGVHAGDPGEIDQGARVGIGVKAPSATVPLVERGATDRPDRPTIRGTQTGHAGQSHAIPVSTRGGVLRPTGAVV